METPVKINSQEVCLAGMWAENSKDQAVIVCHPHPLYGGDMNNPVVTTTVRAFFKQGFSTLRFNFRGVGGSSGEYDNGHGEQKDSLGAIAWLKKKGVAKIHLVGYSFGAWINALVVGGGGVVENLILIAPPITFIEFPLPLKLSPLSLIIAGQQDDYAPPEKIKKLMPYWNPKATLEIIPRTDHFFSGALANLETLLVKHLDSS